ncbi:MAG: hypothetical protein COA58_11155 [Bacteroidetes bacterium]|nr:MAG: hypothetical protein COA58_11155 [Bacteroidota bacterium]
MLLRNTLLFVTISFSLLSNAQCFFNSTNGYSVSVAVEPVDVIPASTSCTWGYNYNVELDYVVTFSGTNIPSSMYTLQGELTCGTDVLFFNLNNSPGSGTLITTVNPYRNASDCNTVTIADLNCNSMEISIEGFNLAPTTGTCAPVAGLPVEFASLEGTRAGKNIVLEWQTASELNNDYFTIEKLNDHKEWEEVNTLEGMGTSNSITDYTYTDNVNATGTVNYRIKQTDFDGASTYSDVIQIEAATISQLSIWPNPATNQLNIYSEQFNSSVVSITNSAGMNISETITYLNQSNEGAVLDISALASGIYFIKIGTEFHRFIKH